MLLRLRRYVGRQRQQIRRHRRRQKRRSTQRRRRHLTHCRFGTKPKRVKVIHVFDVSQAKGSASRRRSLLVEGRTTAKVEMLVAGLSAVTHLTASENRSSLVIVVA